ncbi:MAG: glycosyltransferase family 39 protein [Bacteroidota bacterium]
MNSILRGPFWFALAVTLLIALRFLHFGEDIDGPHSWRQCDTANYAYAFYTEGIDLLHPQVCWMGGHKVTILEFPLPEAIVAFFYWIFGPSHIVARVIFFLFFLGAARYFFLALRLVVAPDLARLATLIYLSLPLGIFYSRAVHVDFSAVFCAHWMFFLFLRGIKNRDARDMLLGSLVATLGLLIKAPYLFYFALPLLAWVIHQQKWDFILRFVPVLLVPVAAFVLWRMHTTAVNVTAPDWDFIPGYHKFVDMSGWYFGVWEQRQMPELWQVLHDRFFYEVTGNWGYFLLLPGLLLNGRQLGHNLMRLWALGTGLYLLIFFSLNVIHNYYQIPLLAPAAFFIAVPIWHVLRWERGGPWRAFPFLAFLLMAALIGNNVRLTEGIGLSEAEKPHFGQYFLLGEPPIAAGKVIRAETPEDALIVASYGGLDCRAPLVLYRGRRNGWSIPKQDLSADLLKRLQEVGAEYLVIIRNPDLPKDVQDYLAPVQFGDHTFGSKNWKLQIYHLTAGEDN